MGPHGRTHILETFLQNLPWTTSSAPPLTTSSRTVSTRTRPRRTADPRKEPGSPASTFNQNKGGGTMDTLFPVSSISLEVRFLVGRVADSCRFEVKVCSGSIEKYVVYNLYEI